ncbi:hypothetical protein P153DRAFT_361759 [Dothidotthia symphoricarpi CBS 119687]|uniref:Uncharacterized protein n=1 Tax=Dothidotthia symphoricarpi CBS 119687 TaxID=1392245 RepID=A0A6A5ZY22_9PLEO|nr:uncharacterized protein P153DRAFT_361759 [Dothidotthia symphoricarpi CBS 119687]KAF2123783.1 hypothetical protein P153DRAFT_361759 [Dothidotthia symphoricarpi CBS 119687]
MNNTPVLLYEYSITSSDLVAELDTTVHQILALKLELKPRGESTGTHASYRKDVSIESVNPRKTWVKRRRVCESSPEQDASYSSIEIPRLTHTSPEKCPHVMNAHNPKLSVSPVLLATSLISIFGISPRNQALCCSRIHHSSVHLRSTIPLRKARPLVGRRDDRGRQGRLGHRTPPKTTGHVGGTRLFRLKEND